MVGYVTYLGIFWLGQRIKLRLDYVEPQTSFACMTYRPVLSYLVV